MKQRAAKGGAVGTGAATFGLILGGQKMPNPAGAKSRISRITSGV